MTLSLKNVASQTAVSSKRNSRRESNVLLPSSLPQIAENTYNDITSEVAPSLALLALASTVTGSAFPIMTIDTGFPFFCFTYVDLPATISAFAVTLMFTVAAFPVAATCVAFLHQVAGRGIPSLQLLIGSRQLLPGTSLITLTDLLHVILTVLHLLFLFIEASASHYGLSFQPDDSIHIASISPRR